MYIILTVLVIGSGFITKSFGDYDTTNYEGDNWREILEEENAELIKENEEFETQLEENEDGFYFGPDMEQVEINHYYLEHDIQPSTYGACQFVADNAGLLSLISLFTSITAAGIIAHEFGGAAIKLFSLRS